MSTSLTPARVVFEFGHNRWRIENEGFNELVTRWHSRHVFLISESLYFLPVA